MGEIAVGVGGVGKLLWHFGLTVEERGVVVVLVAVLVLAHQGALAEVVSPGKRGKQMMKIGLRLKIYSGS